MDEGLLALLAEQKLGVLVTLKRDGRPQMSNVMYAYDSARRLIRISVTADRAKTRNLLRDPRASFHVTTKEGWAWTVAEGDAELTAVTTEPHDDASEELIDVYRSISGEHPDWDEYMAAMIAERRQVVKLSITHAYGQPQR